MGGFGVDDEGGVSGGDFDMSSAVVESDLFWDDEFRGFWSAEDGLFASNDMAFGSPEGIVFGFEFEGEDELAAFFKVCWDGNDDIAGDLRSKVDGWELGFTDDLAITPDGREGVVVVEVRKARGVF